VSKITPLPELVLASSSPFRCALLRQLGLPFRVVKPGVDEAHQSGEDAQSLVQRLSVAKAQAGAQHAPGALSIGSDQVAVHGDRIVGKPADRAAAIAQLLDASEREVLLQTGVALFNSATGNLQSDCVSFRVRFKPLTQDLIERYLDAEQPYDCCGSLRADGLGIALLESLSGDDPSALLGLPLIRLVAMLELEGVAVIPNR
jgi:MAF protein